MRFLSEEQRDAALEGMGGHFLSNRPIRVHLATAKKNANATTASSLQAPHPSDFDTSNTTLFIGGLSGGVTEDELRAVFGRFGDIIYVKIPAGKGCGFVQFVLRVAAEQALAAMNGQALGGGAIRISWGRSSSRAAGAAALGGAAGFPPPAAAAADPRAFSLYDPGLAAAAHAQHVAAGYGQFAPALLAAGGGGAGVVAGEAYAGAFGMPPALQASAAGGGPSAADFYHAFQAHGNGLGGRFGGLARAGAGAGGNAPGVPSAPTPIPTAPGSNAGASLASAGSGPAGDALGLGGGVASSAPAVLHGSGKSRGGSPQSAPGGEEGPGKPAPSGIDVGKISAAFGVKPGPAAAQAVRGGAGGLGPGLFASFLG